MKLKLLTLAAIVAGIVCSCSPKDKTDYNSLLTAQAERLNKEIKELANGSFILLDRCGVTYADASLNVGIEFASPVYKTADFSDALVQYGLAQYLQGHKGPQTDEIINSLSKTEGKMTITITDTESDTKSFDIPAARLRALYKQKLMELNQGEARTSAMKILSGYCAGFADAVNAKECSLDIVTSFAQYTFTFATAAPYARLKQKELAARLLKTINPVLGDMGSCRLFVEDMLKSFSIDGFRFMYENEKDKYTLKSALPWSSIR